MRNRPQRLEGLLGGVERQVEDVDELGSALAAYAKARRIYTQGS